MIDPDLKQKLEQLASRLDRIERHLGIRRLKPEDDTAPPPRKTPVPPVSPPASPSSPRPAAPPTDVAKRSNAPIVGSNNAPPVKAANEKSQRPQNEPAINARRGVNIRTASSSGMIAIHPTTGPVAVCHDKTDTPALTTRLRPRHDILANCLRDSDLSCPKTKTRSARRNRNVPTNTIPSKLR